MSSSEPIPVHITKRREIADDTYELTLELERPFSFQPGQYIDITLPQLPVDPPYRVREFSLASKPTDPELKIAVRKSGTTYKRALLNPAYIGPVTTRGPIGIFTLPEMPTGPLIFVAGGIGITPFMSMLGHLKDRPIKEPITLLRIESNPARAAYRSDLQNLTRELPNLTIVEQFGRLIDTRQLTSFLPAISSETHFYICGPLGMTGHTRTLVRELGIMPLNIHLEEFTGYPDYHEALNTNANF